MAPAAGRQHRVDFHPFAASGCTILEDANYEVLKSPVGDDAYCQAYCRERATQQAQVLELVSGLDDVHVGYYLMRCCTGGRMTYLARTTPPRLRGEALQLYDDSLHEAFSAMLGMQSGGLGLRSAAFLADAAYIGSGSLS